MSRPERRALVEKLTVDSRPKRRKIDIVRPSLATAQSRPDSVCSGSCFCHRIDLLHCRGRRMTRPLHGALIGFGFIAERGHVPAYLAAPDKLKIVAVAD